MTRIYPPLGYLWKDSTIIITDDKCNIGFRVCLVKYPLSGCSVASCFAGKSDVTAKSRVDILFSLWAADVPVCPLLNLIEKSKLKTYFVSMAVRKRLSLTGSKMVFVTTTVFEWERVLTDKNVVKIILKAIDNIQLSNKASIVSYVIMPSHIHLLLGFRDITKLSTCIQGFKSFTSRQVKSRSLALPELATNEYNLWKPRFDDLIISSEKQLMIKIEYIHNNPVKAELVTRAEDWLFSSAGDWLTDKSGEITVDKDFEWLNV